MLPHITYPSLFWSGYSKQRGERGTQRGAPTPNVLPKPYPSSIAQIRGNLVSERIPSFTYSPPQSYAMTLPCLQRAPTCFFYPFLPMISFFHMVSPSDMNLQLHLPKRALFKIERFWMPRPPSFHFWLTNLCQLTKWGLFAREPPCPKKVLLKFFQFTTNPSWNNKNGHEING